jgi:OOP family OmpA-OmpF porin
VRKFLQLLLASLVLAGLAAQTCRAEGQETGPIIASGTVPDEATRVAILSRLREVFGAARVVDNLSVGSVVAPPNWATYATRVIGPGLKTVSRGQLALDGTNLSISGQVTSEAQRQQLASELATSLNPNYMVKNSLQVAAPQQNVLDKTLADRTIEFESGSANITPRGTLVLDEMAAAMRSMGKQKFEVVGHTDNIGSRAYNLALSSARADAVKGYLVAKGIDGGAITTRGDGPDRPVATNATDMGRARNRRIEFRVVTSS